jgi:outer membrane receptor protein involved in Fe transport
MFILLLLAAFLPLPASLSAQQDSVHQHGDSLSRQPHRLHEITVTTTPVPRHDPQTAVQVPREEFLRVPATNTYDALRQTAGLEVHDQGQGPGFASDASLRGFSSDHSTDLALWVDGVPINEPVNGHAEGYNDWYVLFPEAIRDVTVIAGPTSPLFGNFALAGAVNVRTLERTGGTTGDLSGGSYGRLNGSLLSGFDREHSGGIFGLRGVREDGWRPHSGYQLGQGHARLVRDVSPTASVDAGVELYGAGWDSPGFLTADQFDRRAFDNVSDPTDGGFKRRAQERASLRLVTPAGLIWRSTVYSTQGRWQLFLTIPPEGGVSEGTGSQTEEEDTRYGFGATSAATKSLGRSEVTLGAEGRWDHSHYENWLTVNRIRSAAQTLVVARQVSGALFLQTSSDVGPHLRLSVSGRYDIIGTRSSPDGAAPLSDTKGIFSPKIGALYHLKRIADLYANVSRGFRQTNGVITDPSLPLITAWSYETGIKVDTRAIQGSIAVFRTEVSNEQTFDPIRLTTTSGGRSRRQGIDADVGARISRLIRLRGRGTVTDAKYRQLVTAQGVVLNGGRVFNTAKFVAAGNLEVAPEGDTWHAGVATNVVGPYTPFSEPGVELATYALVHLTGGMRIGPAEVDIGVRNLLDHHYVEVRAGGFVSPGQPRSVYGTVRYGF